jgi:hypothetical protein
MSYPKLYYQAADEGIKCVEKDSNSWTRSDFAVVQRNEALLGTGMAALGGAVFHQNDALAIEQKGGVTGEACEITYCGPSSTSKPANL